MVTNSVLSHFNRSKIAILHLTALYDELALDQAILVNAIEGKLQTEAIQQYLKNYTPAKLVGQAQLKDGQTITDLHPMLSKAMQAERVDLLVEARELASRRKGQQMDCISLAEMLNLPVLSVSLN